MKKIILPPLTCLVVVLSWLALRSPVDQIVVEEVAKVIPVKKALPLSMETVDAIRAPSAVAKTDVVVEEKNFEKHQVSVSDEEYRDFKGLPSDLKLAVNVYSMSARDFAPNMGEIVSSDDKTVIFRSDLRPTNANFMAVDPVNNRLYPIAPTVKVANVSEEVRSALVSDGYVEKYYNEDLRVMFVEGIEKNVLEAFASLSGLKLDVELEVIRGYHRAR